jgi:hypothetical protein
MMEKIIISVKDTVAEVFNEPRTEQNVQSAIRAFEHSIKDSPHKDDFVMYQIGTFNPINGEVKGCDPFKIYSGHDVKVQIDARTSDGMIDTVTPLKVNEAG